MTTQATNDFEEVLSFWFGELDEQGRADQLHTERWWRRDAAFDELLRARFGALHEAVARGERDPWLDSPRGRLALIIVLDQLSRNMFRGTARMFACDAKALEVALEGIERGLDRGLACDERTFFYMPLMHSEDLSVQNRCVELFEGFRDELPSPLREKIGLNVTFAVKHREFVERFGRFPHRNALLGRESTPEEAEFLTQPGSSFL
jgi:uncharacterized protein (DUF924 family)